MPETAHILRHAAHLLTSCGLHTGDQFAAPCPGGTRLDVCAAIYIAAHGTMPAEFYRDEDASLALISASPAAMTAIRAVSASLPTEPSVTDIAPGYTVPDHIEHVSNWACTAPVFHQAPPTVSEVIGRLLRTADDLDTTAPQQHPHAA